MAAGLEQDMQTLQALADRARQAAETIARLRTELYESHLREKELQLTLRQTTEELDKARMDLKYLRLSHRLAASPDALVESRRMVANMIRNIDKAIADLKE